MKKVLILTASFGMGHNSVSQAIKESMELEENTTIKVLDLFDQTNPRAYKLFQWIYKTLTQKFPNVYNFFYNQKDAKDSWIDGLMYKLFSKRALKAITNERADVIISTFPMCSGFVGYLKKRQLLNLPLVTVITDIVDSWEWINLGTNLYLVPSSTVREKLILKGVSSDKLIVTGIPVKQSFRSSLSRNSMNNQLLIMGNTIKNQMSYLEKLDQLKDLSVKVITGNNSDLYNQLMERNFTNIEVLGYIYNMHDYMKHSDLIVSKPGGVTLFESINAEIPFATLDSSFGQEQHNIEFIKENKIGLVAKNSSDLLSLICEYYISDESKLKYVGNIKKVKQDFEMNEVTYSNIIACL